MQSHEMWFRGTCRVEHYRGGLLLSVREFRNGIALAARDEILNVYFKSASARPSWYIGLIDGVNSFTGVAPGDTMASHGGWLEIQTYTVGGVAARPAWTPASSTAQSLSTLSAPVEFTFTAPATVAGVFVCSNTTLGSHSSSDMLWCTALYGAALPMGTGDKLVVSYTLTD